MLRWTTDATDHVRNVSIHQRFGVAPIAEKVSETRLRWYCHVLRTNDDTVRKTGLNVDMRGKRGFIHVDLEEAGPYQALDRVKWRHYTR